MSDKNIQSEINIGLVGHVDHGKTTLTEKLSGKWTDTHSEEAKRGITIKLGYADTTLYKTSKGYDVKGKPEEILRKISLVDAPGHESLMATMLAGATIMDGAILMVAANESCPQPQTREHLMVLENAGIERVIIAQNKIDLVSDERALKNYNQIKEFLKGTKFEDAPIIPISAGQDVNIDYLIEAIETYIPTPKRDVTEKPLFLVARSFDINKPGYSAKDLKGGVLGGALLKGELHVGDEIELKPGRIEEENNQLVAKPIKTKITGIISAGKQFDKITPGGSMGIMTTLDPAVVKGDSLTGTVAGHPDKLPPTWHEFELNVNLLNRVVGSQEDMNVEPLKMREMLMLNVNSAATIGQVIELGKNKAKMKLKLPVCAEQGSRVSISRRVGTRFRLIGYGTIN